MGLKNEVLESLRRQSLTNHPIIESIVLILIGWGLSMLIVHALGALR